MEPRKERVHLENVSIEALLDKHFLEVFRQEFKDSTIPVGIVFIVKPQLPLLVNHENLDEFDQRVVHIQSPDEQSIDKLVTVLKKVMQK